MAGVIPTRAVHGPDRRILMLVALVVCAMAPALIALAYAPAWALASVLPLLICLGVLAHGDGRRIVPARRRVVVDERERMPLADCIRRVGRTFGSPLDLPALAQVMAGAACDALDAARTRVNVAHHEARGGPPDAALDSLLDLVGANATGGEHTTYGHSASGHHAMAHPLRDASGFLAVARSARPFTDEERDVLAWLAGQATVSAQNAEVHERLREQPHVDEFTGLGDERWFHETLARQLTISIRTGVPLGLIVLDLDDFKLINDGHGYPVGDRVLAEVGRALRSAVRNSDTVTRSGGEEFSVILPGADLKGAMVAAESVRAAVAQVRVALADGAAAPLAVTASVGVASAPGCARDADGLYAAAGAAMDRAKQHGKDRVGIWDDDLHAAILA